MNTEEKKIYFLLLIALIVFSIASPIIGVVESVFYSVVDDIRYNISDFFENVIPDKKTYNETDSKMIYNPTGSIADAPHSTGPNLILSNTFLLIAFNIITIKYYKERKCGKLALLILIIANLFMPIYYTNYLDGFTGAVNHTIGGILFSCDIGFEMDSYKILFKGGAIPSIINLLLLKK